MIVAETLYAAALAAAVTVESSIDLAGIASNKESALLVAASTRPTVAIVHLQPPVGPDVAHALRCLDSRPNVVAVGVRDSARELIEWIAAGASSCVSRSDEMVAVAAAVGAAASGSIYCSPCAGSQLFEGLVRRMIVLPDSPQSAVVDKGLTRRESEVLRLVAEGLTNREIAAVLGLRVATVKCHVRNVLTKLGLRSREDAQLWVRARERRNETTSEST